MLQFIIRVPSKSERHCIFLVLTITGIILSLLNILKSIIFRIILLSGGDEQSKYSLWSNPRFTSSQLRDLWRTNDPLLTVVRSLLDLFYFKRMHSWPVWIIQGSKGVQTSHINSLRELLSQHKIVRVKLASDKLDAVMISKNFTSDQNLGPRSELLEVKTKGILFQRKSS